MRMLFAEIALEDGSSEILRIPEDDISREMTYEEASAVARHYFPNVIGVFYYDVHEELQNAANTLDGAWDLPLNDSSKPVGSLICELMATTIKYVVAGRRVWK